MKKTFLLMCFISLLSSPLFADKLYLLSNHGNAGDHNQALGIERAMNELSTEKLTLEDIDTTKVTPAEVMKKVEHDLTTQKVVIVGIGEGGVKGVQDLSPQKNLIIALTSHMLLKDYENSDLQNKVNYIALPAHVSLLEKKRIGNKLIETTGVSHNRQSLDVDKTYADYKKELPESDTYFAVVLGGDAPSPTKEIKHFTTFDADKLAQYVIAEVKKTNRQVLVLNGPRTGKYDENGQEIPTSHKNGSYDFVTAHFVKTLESGLDKKNIKVLDFQFKDKPPFNTFDLVLGALKEKEGTILVPGESTSMISEAVDNLPQGKVLIYENGAMNNVHTAHVNSELRAGRASVLKDYQTIQTPEIATTTKTPSAAQVIAKRLVQDLQK